MFLKNKVVIMAVVVAAAVFVIALQFQYLLDLLTSFGDADLQVWSPISEVESLSEYPGTTYPDSWDGINTASACLLVLDENLRLPEWLAYHYHALPLRYLVISVDPRSQKSPSEILDRFRDQGMIIVEWSDYNFTDWQPLPPTAPQTELRDRHRNRQKRFYEACMTHLHHANRTWTAMYDSDEFLTLKDTSNTTRELVSKEGWFIRYVQENNLTEAGCFSFPRVLFGAQEIPSDELHSDHPDELDAVDPMRFDTLRFRYHAEHGHKLNGHGKAVIDVSKIREHLPLYGKVPNPHRPLSICDRAMYHNVKSSPFLVHHYLGSWEAYSFRDDSRKHAERSREAWEYRASLDHIRNDQLSGWLKEFVTLHGPERASTLLHEVGLPPDYHNEDDPSDWAFDPNAPSYRGKENGIHKDFFQFLRQRNESLVINATTAP